MSLNRHGPAANPALGKPRARGYFVGHRLVDLVEVESVVVGDHVELVGHRELDVAPGVVVELRQLGADRGQHDHVLGQQAEERAGPLDGARRRARDDLRQRVDLLQRDALGHALGAEGHVDLEAGALEGVRDVVGRARVDRAAHDQQLPVAQARTVLPDQLAVDLQARVQVLVERRADDRDDRVGRPDDVRVSAGLERALAQHLEQQLVRALVEEGHATTIRLRDLRRVDVEGHDLFPGPREGQTEGQSYVPAAADDDDVGHANPGRISQQWSVGHRPTWEALRRAWVAA